MSVQTDQYGNIVLGQAAGALPLNSSNGFVVIPTCAGTPTGTPAFYNGMSPFVYDTVGKGLWMYSGGIWNALAGGGGPVTGYLKTDGTVPMAGNLDMGGNSIVDLNAITAGDIVLDSSVTPPNPVAGDVGMAAVNYGYIVPYFLQPDGYRTMVQDALWGNVGSYLIATPSPTTMQFQYDSMGLGDTSTQAGFAPAITNDFTRFKRVDVTSAASSIWRSAGYIPSAAGTNTNYWLGNAANLGGFFFACAFSPKTWGGNGSNLFVGLTSFTGNIMTGLTANQTDPGVHAYHGIGIGCDSTDSSVPSIFTSDGTSVTTKTAIGGAPALASGMNPLRIYFYASQNATSIAWRLDQLTSGVWTKINSGTVLNSVAHFPSNTTYMQAQVAIGSGTTVSQVAISVGRIYIYGLG
jgi:hypothetical protein